MLSLAEQMAEEMGWKKGKEGQKKGGKAHKHLTVEDILSMEKAADFVHEGEAPSTGAKQVIKDLRGPQEKLLTNLDEINYEVSEGVAGVDEELKLGQELLHNVTVVLDMCESVLYGLDKSIKTEQSHISKLEKRLGELEVLVEEGEGKLQRMNSVSEILTRVQQRINEDASKVPMEVRQWSSVKWFEGRGNPLVVVPLSFWVRSDDGLYVMVRVSHGGDRQS